MLASAIIFAVCFFIFIMLCFVIDGIGDTLGGFGALCGFIGYIAFIVMMGHIWIGFVIIWVILTILFFGALFSR